MQDLKMSPAQDQTCRASAHREPYKPPTVTVIPLKIEERLLACQKSPALACNGKTQHGMTPNAS